jgi:hypothetical protein
MVNSLDQTIDSNYEMANFGIEMMNGSWINIHTPQRKNIQFFKVLTLSIMVIMMD